MKIGNFIFCFFILSSLSLKSQILKELKNAIDIADKQKMILQKLATEKIFFEEDKRTTESEVSINYGINEFNLGTEILKDLSPTKDLKYQIAIEELTFRMFSRLLNSNDDEALEEILYMNDLFVKICEETSQSFIKHTCKEQKLIKTIKVAGSLRYLLHRLSLYQSIHYFGIRTIYPEEINQIITSINKRINYLTVSEYNTFEIDEEISKTLYYWNNIKKQLEKSKKNKAGMSMLNPEKLVDLSGVLSEKLNILPSKYIDLIQQ